MKDYWKGIDTVIAQSLSVALHPLIVPLYSILLLYFNESATQFRLHEFSAFQVFTPWIIFTMILPGIFVLFLRQKGKISSIYLKKRMDREGPLLFAAASAFILNGLYFFIAPNPLLLTLPLILIVSILIDWAVNKFWKISIHMTSLGGLSSIIIFFSWHRHDIFPRIVLILLLIGILLGWARWRLKAHTFMQVILGWINGFVIALACLKYLPDVFSSLFKMA